MYYREIAPRNELKSYIKCFWFLEDPLNSFTNIERVIPDGRMELVFHYGSPFQKINGNEISTQSKGIITGQIRKPIFLKPTGSIGICAVRFFPFGFSSLFTIPASELSLNLFSMDDVLGTKGKELEEKILNSEGQEKKISILEDFFMSLLADRGDYDFRIHRVTRKIYELKGIFRLEDLAREFHISPRQLERLFQQKIGLSPNVFGRIVRFQSVVATKISFPTLGLTDLSHAAGYYDQSHFIKDFKDFSGLSPKQYFSEIHRMTDLFTKNL